jgi:hypothetical protein
MQPERIVALFGFVVAVGMLVACPKDNDKAAPDAPVVVADPNTAVDANAVPGAPVAPVASPNVAIVASPNALDANAVKPTPVDPYAKQGAAPKLVAPVKKAPVGKVGPANTNTPIVHAPR